MQITSPTIVHPLAAAVPLTTYQLDHYDGEDGYDGYDG